MNNYTEKEINIMLADRYTRKEAIQSLERGTTIYSSYIEFRTL